MMDILTVSLFGHRDLDDPFRIKDMLTPLVGELLSTQHYVSFLVGRNGEFDECAASAIKRAQAAHDKSNSELTLVLPYAVADMKRYEEYYDGIILPECVQGAHPKGAIRLKNRWMVEQSDLVIVYIERESGGAYTAMKYAQRLHKKVINLYS